MAISAPVNGTLLTVSVAATTWNVPWPTVQADDQVAMGFSMATTSALSTPAGWTSIGNLTASGATTPRVALFLIKATGSESGSLAVTTPSSTGQARMFRIRGVDPTTPQDAAATTVSLAATTAYNIPGITTVTDGAMLFGWVGSNTSGSGTFTPPTIQGGFTEIHDDNVQNHSSAAYVLMATAGASGTANFVRSGSVRGAGVLLALRPFVPSSPPRNIRSYNPAIARSFNW